MSCSDHGIAILAKILKTSFSMLMIIGPVLAMASLGYLFLCVVTSPDADKDGIYKKRIKNSLMALVITFFLPFLVNLTMSATFMAKKFQINACWKEADNVVFGDSSEYVSPNDKDDKEESDRRRGTMIIDPDAYKGKNTN